MAITLNNSLRYALIGFYAFAGTYHFINPDFYYELIPPYLPFPKIINYVSGIAEIMLAIGVGIAPLRALAVKGLIVMLIAFIPSHVYFIQAGSCVNDSLCVDPWIAWARLLVIHPLLILWAWKVKD
ncbi:DoxX family protein [Winogradskyella aurantiaca]|uniref:DoxX family protein n=1 Tax=Winogradskyella aurantiaca TaxID=2219558 RepID=UPI000E1D32D8|nr:hypothetical protein [Winogradskyella aurantiaca]